MDYGILYGLWFVYMDFMFRMMDTLKTQILLYLVPILGLGHLNSCCLSGDCEAKHIEEGAVNSLRIRMLRILSISDKIPDQWRSNYYLSH